MALSPLQINAGAGLLQNTGLMANANLTIALTDYSTLPFVAAITGAITTGSTGNILANTTLVTLETIASNTCPALGDSSPSSNIPPGNSGFSGLIWSRSNAIMGGGDLTKFSQTWAQAQGYIAQCNQFITDSAKSQANFATTFDGMNSLSTNSISDITTNPQLLGADLKNLGNLFEPANLENWGTPFALVQQFVALTGLVPPPLQVAFVTMGIDHTVAVNLDDPTVSVTDSIQKTMWRAFELISGDSLLQLLQLLGVKTSGIATLADLLNPQKILPTSYSTLRTPTAFGFVPVYLNGSINPVIAKTWPGYALRSTDPGYNMTAVDRTSYITTSERALANKCLAVSLLQIDNVFNLSLPELADAIIAIELIDQPLVTAATSAIADPGAYTQSIAPGGTGPGGTLVISDVIGTPTGFSLTGNLTNTVSNLATMNTATLTSIYQTMQSVVVGTYGNTTVSIPVGQPGAGNYANRDSALSTSLIPLAQTEIANLIVAYPAATANLNTNWSYMGNQIGRELGLCARANIDPTLTPANSPQSMMSFVSSLPDYGTDIGQGGSAAYLRAVANTANVTGQYVVATLTSGKNISALSKAGIAPFST